MKNYRDISQDKILLGKCICCDRLIGYSINIHHIDGNKKNNEENNLIAVCKLCHTRIHKGFNKRCSINEQQINNILALRKVLLIKHFHFTEDIASMKIKYEKAICTQTYKKHRCIVCFTEDKLRLITPEFVKVFDKKNKKKIGYYLCKNCQI